MKGSDFIDRYTARINLMGTTQRERELNRLKQSILKDSQTSLSYKNVTINDIETHLMIDSTNNPNIKEIKSLPNENLNMGDYVVWNGLTWLVTKSDVDDEVYSDGVMELCNYSIKFQSPDGTILSYPCITSTKSFNQDDTKMITLPSNQKSILCAKDANTLLLKTDRRLYVDTRNESTYKIIGDVDTTSYNYGDKGLLYFVVQQDETQADDRSDLGICDYFIKAPTPTGARSVITCSNPSNELTVGSSYYATLSSTQYDSYNNIVAGINPIWSFEYPTGYSSYFSVVYEGKLVKIKVAENYNLVGKILKVNVSNGSNGYKGSLDLIIKM